MLPSERDFQKALNHLKDGKIVAYPTESIWGLGVDPFVEGAVEKIRDVKKRDSNKSISLLVSDIEMAKQYFKFSDSELKLAQLYWPGPLTIVLQPTIKFHSNILGPNGSIGVRCSSHPIARRLVSEYSKPITTTSANISGNPPAKSLEDLNWLPKDVFKLSNDICKGSQGSTVVRFNENKLEILRQGILKII